MPFSAGKRFDLLLLTERGRRIDTTDGGAEVRVKLKPGRYFVAVRALDASEGAYKLSRKSKVITRTSAGIGPRRSSLGTALRIGVRIRPSVGGPFTVIIQRFDPLSGWLFYRTQHGRAVRGRGAVTFTPPAIGRWRARATFDGTLRAGSSENGFAEALVVGG